MTHEEMIDMLESMKFNCEHANHYDDPDRAKKAEALGYVIDWMSREATRAAEPSETAETTGYIRAGILDEAKYIITADRNKQYSEPENNFAKIGDLWSAYLGCEICAHDVAIMMALFKIGRIVSSDKRDSYVDACGYIACAGEIAEKTSYPGK